jgi:hypothetical protein
MNRREIRLLKIKIKSYNSCFLRGGGSGGKYKERKKKESIR